MYIIMYKYIAFRINHKSFRSSMSKNFTVIPDLLRLPVKPAMTVGPSHGRPLYSVMTDLIGHLLCHPGSDPSVIPGSDRGSLCEQVGGQAILP